RQFGGFSDRQSNADEETTQQAPDSQDASLDPTERLEQAYQELQFSLADDLLSLIKQQTPAFFEKLVVQLMLAMGYGGWSEKAGQATQYTNDGGIDGIIHEDPLGLDTFFLPVQRYHRD